MSKSYDQHAALPIRWDEDGNLRILLVTSRETKRWVMPKGWPIDGLKPWRTAEVEALEEAGVRGRISDKPIGTYSYDKILDEGESLNCTVTLYPMIVSKVLKRWKERDQRTRRWFSAKGAAKAVQEVDLSGILSALHKAPGKQRVIRKLCGAKLQASA